MDAMKTAFKDLGSIISNKSEETYYEQTGEPLKAIVNEIFTYFGVKNKIVDVPDEIDDLNAQLEYILRPAGIMTKRVELTGDWWKDSEGVLLGFTKDGDMAIMLPAFPMGYKYYDKKLGKKVRVNKENFSKINIEAFSFYISLPAKKLNLMDLGLFIAQRMTYLDIGLILGASLIVSLLGLFTPYINKEIFSNIIPSGIKGNVIPLGVLLIGVSIGSTLFKVTQGMIIMRMGDRINLTVSSAAMARVFALPAAFFKDFSAGELSSRVMSINTLCIKISDTVFSIGLTTLFSFVYIFQMARFAPVLTGPSLGIILFMFLFTILTGFIQQRVINKEKNLSAKMNGLIFGLFSGIQKIKLAGAEKRAFGKWASTYKELGKIKYSPPIYLKMNEAISGALVLGGTIILYYFAGVNEVSASDYIGFSVAYGLISGAIMSLADTTLALANIKPLLEMVKPILEWVPEIDESKKQVTSLSGDIEISNVSFRYSENDPIILDNISLRINPGEYVAVVGTSGSGKSTLMRLLLGFEKPESGAVYYDGNDLDTLDVRSVRQSIGTCLQDGKLFSGDIFSNIIVTAPWSTLDDAWRAARRAGIEEDIKAMPMGMHTIISEGSGSISGGQRQRILIARALVSNPQILFFDEATSALDNITQRIVSDSIDTLGCTRVVIAHRLSTVINCDKIIVIDKGEIVETGSYDELMSKKGLFYELVKRQIS